MQTEVRFSSKRFMLTLMVSACSVILLQNYNLSDRVSFTLNLICIAGGMAVSLLIFVPSILLKRKTNEDVFSLAKEKYRRSLAPLTVFYAVYFVFVSEFFLLQYTDMFKIKYYENAPCSLIASVLLAVCVYAASKGTNVISRFGIFLFAFALFTNILMYAGSISTLDFELHSFAFSGETGDVLKNTLYFVTPSFVAAFFACLSGQTENFRISHPLASLGVTALKYAAIMFFTWFSLGAYANRQEFQTFMLSRVARFGDFGGIESFYLALTTVSVFLIVSLSLCCVGRGIKSENNTRTAAIMAAVIFILHICAKLIEPLNRVFVSPFFLVILTVIAAAVIPMIYLFAEKRYYA